MSTDTDKKPDHWLVRKSTIRGLWIGFIIVLILVALADLLMKKHAHFGVDGWFGFYWIYGFGTCLIMVIFAKALGIFVKRRDDYYDDE